jgi:hypothetical protein
MNRGSEKQNRTKFSLGSMYLYDFGFTPYLCRQKQAVPAYSNLFMRTFLLDVETGAGVRRPAYLA